MLALDSPSHSRDCIGSVFRFTSKFQTFKNSKENKPDIFLIMITTMKTMKKACLFCSAFALLGGYAVSSPAMAQGNHTPALVITHAPLPQNLRDKIYTSPRQVREIKPQELMSGYRNTGGTAVGGEINELRNDLNALQGRIGVLADNLTSLQREGETLSAEYYANVATIQTQLRNGTTPGNPRLVSKLNGAESSLQGLSRNAAQLSDLSVQVSDAATQSSFLLESARSAYSLSGAVEEDHVVLAQLEDSVNNTVVIIERVLNTITDSLTRTTAYLSSERDNIRTLALAVTNGDLYGRSIANRPFATAAAYQGNSADFGANMNQGGNMGVQQASAPASAPSGSRALARIVFDSPDVEYEQPLYVAVNEALQRYPNARFDLVAVHPSQGNAAEIAIESTRARRNAERVLRAMTGMGVPTDRVDLAYDQSDAASSNEVHLYIK